MQVTVLSPLFVDKPAAFASVESIKTLINLLSGCDNDAVIAMATDDAVIAMATDCISRLTHTRAGLLVIARNRRLYPDFAD